MRRNPVFRELEYSDSIAATIYSITDIKQRLVDRIKISISTLNMGDDETTMTVRHNESHRKAWGYREKMVAIDCRQVLLEGVVESQD